MQIDVLHDEGRAHLGVFDEAGRGVRRRAASRVAEERSEVLSGVQRGGATTTPIGGLGGIFGPDGGSGVGSSRFSSLKF